MWASRHYGPWQPLSWLSWSIDSRLFGLDPAAFRRVNIILHAATAAWFYLAFRRKFPKAELGAVAAALFFALHPLRVESVLWITERRDVLSGFFAVLSIWLWLENKSRISLAAFAAAVLSKGTAIAVIPFLIALEPRRARELGPYLALALFAVWKNLGGAYGLALSLTDRVLIAGAGGWFYLSKTLAPVGLSPYYALPLDPAAIGRVALPRALLATLVTAGCCRREVRAWALPAWLAYLAALAPASGLFQNGRQAAADRYSYLACMPFAVLFGLGVEKLKTGKRELVAAVAILLALLTVRQAKVWTDDVSLWTRAVEVEPDAYLPNSNLSVALLVAGRNGEAVAPLRAAIRLEPRDAEARVNLASILAGRGENDEAITLFREAVALKPSDPSFDSARHNLGVLLKRRGL